MIDELSEQGLKVGFHLFCLKRELEEDYSYIDHQEIISYLNKIENIYNEKPFPFDMDHLINVLEDKYNIHKTFQHSSYQKDWIKFCGNHMFIRTGWMSSTDECGGYNKNSNCNWKSSTEECEGISGHAIYYQSLINFVFGS